jgi:hypothetical protein
VETAARLSEGGNRTGELHPNDNGQARGEKGLRPKGGPVYSWRSSGHSPSRVRLTTGPRRVTFPRRLRTFDTVISDQVS